METNNNAIGAVAAAAIDNPGEVMQSLDNLKNTLQQISNTASGMQTEDDSASQWSFEDTIDELMSKISGYTYYDLPWTKRNTPKGSSNRYNIDDESGTVKANASEEDVIDRKSVV